MKLLTILYCSLSVLGILLAPPLALAANVPFEDGWRIQSSKTAGVAGAVISQPEYGDSSWHPAKAPSTILANFADDSLFYGDRIMSFMGTPPFSPGSDEAAFLDPTPASSPFASPWWYRRVFTLPEESDSQKVELTLDGITYGAQVWVNGTEIASRSETPGSYRAFHWEISKYLRPAGQPNAIAVLVDPPGVHDLTPSWVDWNITPQDKNMGIWRGATLRTHGGVRIAHPQVVSQVALPSASLTVRAEIQNTSDAPVNGQLEGEIEGIRFTQTLSLSPGETESVAFTPTQFPRLRLAKPRLWWPAQMGKPELYHLKLEFKAEGSVSDRAELDFGIRQIDSWITEQESRQFAINGKPLLIRGGGWASDLLLRYSPERAAKELRYVQDLGLNTVRLEGMMQPDDFFAQADKLGILVMPGLVCCNAWEMDAKKWTDAELAVAKASVRDLALALRAHPSVFAFLYGSDEAPPERVEKAYVDALQEASWPNPMIAAAAWSDTPLGGESGVKMLGPYDYVSPAYWYTDKKGGGAYGFNTESSPGPSIPSLEALRKFIPPESMGAFDSIWSLHSGRNGFANLNFHTGALTAMFGAPTGTADMVRKSQLMDYSDHRAMFEAFNRNKKQGATGIIQWMLNNAWPSLIWHLYDYYLEPGAAYFGVKEANRPLHLIYGYDDRGVWLVNSTYQTHRALKIHARVYDLGSNLLSEALASVKELEPDASVLVRTLPPMPGNTVTFVDLELQDEKGAVLDRNFYWLPANPPAPPLEFGQAEGDFRALEEMPKAKLEVTQAWDAQAGEEQVRLSNPGPSIALLVNLRLADANGETLVPVLWGDNDFSLGPGETRVIRATLPEWRGEAEPVLHVEGWNLSN